MGSDNAIPIFNAGDIDAKVGAVFTGDAIYAQTYAAIERGHVINRGKIARVATTASMPGPMAPAAR